MKTIFVLSTLILGSLACQEIFGNATFYSQLPSGSISKFSKIDNVTILCANIYSIDEIYYSYSEEIYDQFLNIINSNVSTLMPFDFATFSSIKKLHLTGIHVKEIRKNAFLGLIDLKSLYLNKNELSVIPQEVFSPLKSLQVLDLSENKIVKIARFAFSTLNRLLILSLELNKLSTLEEGTFKGLTQLMHLDLSGNPVVSVPIKDLTPLQFLSVANTSVRRIDPAMQLGVLDFSRNDLTSVDFSTIPKPKALFLNDNSLTSFKNVNSFGTSQLWMSNNSFSFFNVSLKGLSVLSMANNSLEKIDSLPFQQSKSILIINFSNNRISSIAPDTFHRLSFLSFLFLDHNKITSLDANIFRDLSNLEFLVLDHNNIEVLHDGTFTNLKHLESLNLSFNKLKTLTFSLFSTLSSLDTLDISHNGISVFDGQNLLGSLPLRSLSLDGNKWTCKDLIQLAETLKEVGGNITSGSSFHRANFHGVACKSDSANASSDTLSATFEERIDEVIEDSKLKKFLNEDFEQSSLAKFVQKKYDETADIGSVLGALKQEKSGGGGNGVAIAGLLLQMVTCVVVVGMAYFMYTFVRGNGRRNGAILTEMEV